MGVQFGDSSMKLPVTENALGVEEPLFTMEEFLDARTSFTRGQGQAAARVWGGYRSILCHLILGVLACGCTSPSEYIRNGFEVGPRYSRPPAPVAEAWIDSADVRVRSES